MAVTSTTIWEVESLGNDAHGGGFDPGVTGFATDLAATSGNTASPVVSSASYNFVSGAGGDVGAWVFVKAGTNWNPGWYKITSVASNQATLDATAGHGIQYPSMLPTTTTGVATVASPSAGTWGVDYSQQNNYQVSYTDIVASGTGTLTSAAHPFGPNHVGNVLHLTSSTGGTGFVGGWFVIASVAANVATLNAADGTSWTGGNAYLGGALATPNAASNTVIVGGNSAYLQGGTAYTTGTALAPPAGTSTAPSRLIGYTTYRGDGGQATIQASAAITNIVNAGNWTVLRNLVVDANGWSVSQNLNTGSDCQADNLFLKKVSSNNSGAQLGNRTFLTNYRITCTSGATSWNGILANGNAVVADGGVIDGTGGSGTACVGFQGNGYQGSGIKKSLIVNIPGVGANIQNGWADSNTIDGCASDAIQASGSMVHARNNLLTNNTGKGINYTTGALLDHGADYNFFYSNTGGNYSTGFSPGPHDVVLTANPYTNRGSGNYGLNSTAGGGAAVRAAAFPGAFQSTSTTGYPDGGAVQSQNTGSGNYQSWVG